MKQLLTKKQAAEYLNISPRTLDYFRERGNLPCHIIGGERGKLVRFDARELEKWALGRNTDDDSNDTDNDNNNEQEERQ